ncbi:BnaA10g09740D [Brassica napus]|uniref:BnaA10g09740D protein n=1 Tax=Brassica napus TaxID=3708 RepID=A0A078FS34_BRANA|nr:BnaA10g09740D [Brassica napus]
MSEAAILGFLQTNESILDSGQFAAEHNLDHEEVKNVIKSLQGFRYIEAKLKRETLVLTDDGKKYAVEGSPEIHFFSAKDDLEVMITMLLIISFIFHWSRYLITSRKSFVATVHWLQTQ